MNTRHYDNDKLKRARESLGWTQVYVAKRLGVHEQTIIGAENGTRNISFELLNDYANLLGCDAADFLHRRATISVV
jgi:transcriptional regulator with XRE-family HTH domain